MRSFSLVLLALAVCGCSDTQLSAFGASPPSPPPRDGALVPPEDPALCDPGWKADYFNFVAPAPPVAPAPADPRGEAWWSGPRTFERFDPGLDFGVLWWPVDEGLDDDPGGFAVRWQGWVVADGDGELELAMAVRDDAWILVDGEPVLHSSPKDEDFGLEARTVEVPAGLHPLEVRFLHRSGDPAGFTLRQTGGSAWQCAPGSSGADPEG